MRTNQLTDEQLKGNLNQLVDVYLASCELDNDFIHLEEQVEALYAEAQSRGIF